MNYDIILIIILFCSLFGLLTIIFRKIPILAEFPEISEGQKKERFWLRFKNKIVKCQPLKSFSLELFLQKILSRIRILTLRIESKTAAWLQKLREKSHQKKKLENDNYWQELKKSKE